MKFLPWATSVTVVLALSQFQAEGVPAGGHAAGMIETYAPGSGCTGEIVGTFLAIGECFQGYHTDNIHMITCTGSKGEATILVWPEER